MDEIYANFVARKNQLEDQLADAISHLEEAATENLAIPMPNGQWLALGTPDFISRIADAPHEGGPIEERQQAVAQAAAALLTFMRSSGFSQPLDDTRWLAFGSPESLKRAADTSGMQPYLGSD